MLECSYELKEKLVVDVEKSPNLKDTFGAATPPVLVCDRQLADDNILRIRISPDGTITGKIGSWAKHVRKLMEKME
jgi:hypothetical protein